MSITTVAARMTETDSDTVQIVNSLLDMDEILTDPYPYEWLVSDQEQWLAGFETKGGQQYLVNFSPVPGEIRQTEMSFLLRTPGRIIPLSTGIEGTGDATRVFSTAFAALGDYIKQNNPPQLIFTAKEPSRKKLYRHLVRRFPAQDFGPYRWSVEAEADGPGETYVLTRIR